MRTSEKVATISAALYAVHRDLENPRKDAKGQVRGRADYRYLSLPALIDHAKVALKEAQVAVIQDVRMVILAGNVPGIGVDTTFMHLTGEWLEVGPIAMAMPADPQQLGSVTTYLRRYALAAALNLAADEDDDGSSASTRAPVTERASGDGGQADGNRATAAADGEDAAERAAPVEGEGVAASQGDPRASTPSAQPAGHHDHQWAPSPTLPGWRWCTVKGCGKAEKTPMGARA